MQNNTIKIIQITDTHLFADDELDILGVKSNRMLKAVIGKIRDEDSHDTDLILLTGDVSQDETAASYQKAVDYLSELRLPVYWIPGNHDHLPHMEAVFNSAKHFFRKNHLSLPNWHFIFLDTTREGTAEGYLSQAELILLKNEIAASPRDKKIVLVMHHHPIQVGTPLIDRYILSNRDDFWKIVTGTRVSLMICGHVHGDYQIKHHQIVLETSPATCLQWQQGTEEMKIDLRIGYKVYYFNRDHYQAITKMW